MIFLAIISTSIWSFCTYYS